MESQSENKFSPIKQHICYQMHQSLLPDITQWNQDHIVFLLKYEVYRSDTYSYRVVKIPRHEIELIQSSEADIYKTRIYDQVLSFMMAREHELLACARKCLTQFYTSYQGGCNREDPDEVHIYRLTPDTIKQLPFLETANLLDLLD